MAAGATHELCRGSYGGSLGGAAFGESLPMAEAHARWLCAVKGAEATCSAFKRTRSGNRSPPDIDPSTKPGEIRGGEVSPGVIFCLRQNDERKDPKDTNPTFPYYVVHVTEGGSRVPKHTQPKAAPDLMRAACSGRREPPPGLCRAFNDETRDGMRMDAYTDLLDDVVGTITDAQETKGMESLFSPGEVGSGVSLGFDDYSLVSFVVPR